MKKMYMTMVAILAAAITFAQTDSAKTTGTTDTLKVGNFIIIKKNKSDNGNSTEVTFEKKTKKPSLLSTNWFIFDLGFANIDDRTNYGNPGSSNYLRGSFTKNDFKLRTSKSSNVNIWFVMQKLNIAKGYVNLKYGLGLEMFNFRYEQPLNYEKDNLGPYIFRDTIKFSKNKLYAGYLTVPVMLNLVSSPGKKRGITLSAGISAGYRIGTHDKQISGERGKDKTYGNLGLEQFRLAYVGELGIGPIRLFGSYAITKLHENALEQYPYSLGIRFSNW